MDEAMDAPAVQNGVDEMRLGVPLEFACDIERLGELAHRFVPSQLDAEGEAFLATALRRRHTRFGYWAHRALTLFLSDFDVNALLGTHPVFLLSTPAALGLIEAARPGGVSGGRWLDIGAGSGDVTTRLAPLADAVQCSETSRYMARRLRRRGFRCWLGSVGEGEPGDPLLDEPPFDVVSLFNVIDRAPRPRSLLQAVAQRLPSRGLLLLSTPLPFAPFYYAGSVTRDPLEKLNVASERWEDALGELWRNELAPLGLALRAVTRLPYLSGGDVQHPAYILDAAVLVCEKP
jgi:SAM-dependent methyltransferase